MNKVYYSGRLFRCHSVNIPLYSVPIYTSTETWTLLFPCWLTRRPSLYFIIRFIADYILPSSSCYYRYDLGKIRSGSLTAGDVDESVVDFTTVHDQSIYALNPVIIPGVISTSTIQAGLCTNRKVCDVNWQNFIKCLVIDQLAKRPDGSILISGTSLIVRDLILHVKSRQR